MKKEFLFFAILSFIVLIDCIESPDMGVGIASLINASLTVKTVKTVYYQGQTADIVNTLKNTGNTESIGNLTTRLFAPNGSEIFKEDWFDVPLELTTLPEYYSTSYDFSSDADVGIYIIVSNYSYSNKIANASTEFELKQLLLKLSVLTEKDTYCLSEMVDIVNSLKNLGTENVTGNLSTKVLDPKSNQFLLASWQQENISAGEGKDYKINYTVYGSEDVGNYKIESEFLLIFDGSLTRVKSFRVFEVRVCPITTVLPTPPGVPGVPGVPVKKIANISVEYPHRLNLTQDVEYTVFIKVTNVGGVPIHNLFLKLESREIETEVLYPGLIPVLEINSSILFTTRLKVPAELKSGSYGIDWFVYSDEINKTGTILGDVRILGVREKAKDLIEYYIDLVNRLEKEIEDAEEECKNITLARGYLGQTKLEMETAKELFKLELYPETIEGLGLVREWIVKSAIELVKARSTCRLPVTMPAVVLMPCLIWIIIVIALDSIIIAILTKKRSDWINTILIIIMILIFIVLLVPECLIWIILATLVMITIATWMKIREEPRKRPRLPKLKKW